MATVKLLKLLANLGYGSRREVSRMLKNGWVNDDAGREYDEDAVIDPEDHSAYAAIRVDGEPLDPPPGMVLMLHKPVGYTCSSRDVGRLVYELLPPRFKLRKPLLSTIGRLDRDSSGLLLFTDDGPFLHRVIAPKSGVEKCYEVELAHDLRGDEATVFGAGTLLLEGETQPLAPVSMIALGPRRARLILTEGRYHQVRRMFAAVGNHVQGLQRLAVGGLTLEGLAASQWRLLGAGDAERIFQRCVISPA